MSYEGIVVLAGEGMANVLATLVAGRHARAAGDERPDVDRVRFRR